MFHVIKINVAGQGSRKEDGIRNSFNVKKHLSPASRPRPEMQALLQVLS